MNDNYKSKNEPKLEEVKFGEERPEEIPQVDPGSAPPVQPDPLKS